MSYKITLRGIRKDPKLKEMVEYLSGALKLPQPQVIEMIRNLPALLLNQCSEVNARNLKQKMESLGAVIEITPELPDPEKEKFKHHVPKPLPQSQEKGKAYTRKIIMFMAVIIVVALSVLLWLNKDFLKSFAKSQRASKVLENSDHHDIAPNHPGLPYLSAAITSIAHAREQMKDEGWSQYGKTGAGGLGALDKMAIKDADAAFAYILEAQKYLPNHPEVYRWKGYILQQKGLYKEAEAAFLKAVSLAPKNIIYHHLLANLYVDEEFFSKADFSLRKALTLDSNFSGTLKNLSILNLFHLKDSANASYFLYKYLQSDSKNDFDRFELKKELMFIKWKAFNHRPFVEKDPSPEGFSEYESRRKSLVNKIKLEENSLYHEELGILFAERGMLQAAKLEWSKGLEIDRDRHSLHVLLAYIQAEEKQFDAVKASLVKAIKSGSNDPGIYKNLFLLAKYYDLDKNSAEKWYKKYWKFQGDSYGQALKREYIK